jgi:hypothetical protein
MKVIEPVLGLRPTRDGRGGSMLSLSVQDGTGALHDVQIVRTLEPLQSAQGFSVSAQGSQLRQEFIDASAKKEGVVAPKFELVEVGTIYQINAKGMNAVAYGVVMTPAEKAQS